MASLRFESKVPAVRELVIRGLPSHRITKAVKSVSDGMAVYIMGSRGTVYCNLRSGENIKPLHMQSVSSLSALRVCVRLGALPQKDYDEHAKYVAEREADGVKREDLWKLEYMAGRHGFKVTAAQRKKLTA